MNALHYPAMPGKHQYSICTAIALWIAAVVFATVYGIRHGYTGHAFLVMLGILAFFLAVQLALAGGNLGERLARSPAPVSACCCPLFPFLLT